MKKYKVNSIFYSIQGEGAWVGTSMIFIRFSGCNLSCSFCDTEFDSYTEMSVSQILNKIKNYPCSIICLTGGEPLLQVTNELIEDLNCLDNEYTFHIETNGTIETVPDSIDWFTVSPKENWKLREGDELKVIWQGQSLKELNDKYMSDTDFDFYWLQPEYSYLHVPFLSPLHEERLNKLCDLVKEDSRWGISVQLQKILKIQ